MNKPVDGAEAMAREVLADTRIATGKVLGDCPDAVAVRAMLAHSAALVAENERLREALRPFADDLYPGSDWSDDLCGPETMASAGMVRAARTALETHNG